MNKESYFKIMVALTNLMVVIMVEGGRVTLKTAQQVGHNVLKATTGRTLQDKDK